MSFLDAAVWSPQLFIDRDNELRLFFTHSRHCSHRSSFKGRTWVRAVASEAARRACNRVLGFGSSNGIQ